MSAPDPSKLDLQQILQRVFDEQNGKLRTDSTATVVNADIDVALDAREDNVAIKSSTGTELVINPDGSINTTVQTNLVASTPTISNTILAVLGTEYSLQLPTNTKKFVVKAVQASAVITMSFVSGGAVVTIPKGCSYEIDGVLLTPSNRTIYLISDTNDTKIEVVSWL